eukprot:RCo024494
MFNHSATDPSAHLDTDQTLHRSGGVSGGLNFHSFVVQADRDVSPGEEVVLCYGPLSNSTLFVEYGFVEPQNPHDMVGISGRLVRRVCERWCRLHDQSRRCVRQKRVALRNAGVLPSESRCQKAPPRFLLSKQELVPPALLLAVQVYVMPPTQWAEAGPTLNLRCGEDLGVELSGDDSVRATYKLLLRMVRVRTSRYYRARQRGVPVRVSRHRKGPDPLAVRELARAKAALAEAQRVKDGVLEAVLSVRIQELRMLLELQLQLLSELQQ